MANEVNEVKKIDKRLAREEQAAKTKRKERLILFAVAVCVVLCVVLTVLESNFIYRKISAAKVEDTTYSVAEYNWMYTNDYYEIYENLYSTYGSYISYVLDTTKPLSEQQFSEDQTWDEYIADYTKEALVKLTVLYNKAKEAGWELEESYLDTIDSDWESIKASATEYGTDAASYLVSVYGKGVNEKVYRSMYEKYYYAYSYANSLREDIKISDSDIDAEYKENAQNYDMVSYKYYYVSGTAAEGEDETAALEAAKETAEAVKAAQSMEDYVETELSSSVNNVNSQPYDNVSTTYADWLFDSARVSGDREVFDATTGYYVIEFVEKADLHYNMVNVRHCLVSPEDTSDDASWEEAYANAKKYLDTFNELGGTEDYFAYIAQAYSDDTNTQSTGGLYENVYKGEMVEEFEDWCFDSKREPGDVDIVRTTYGYHLMYFVSEGEEYYTYTIDNSLRNTAYSEMVDGFCDGIEMEALSGIKYTATQYK